MYFLQIALKRDQIIILIKKDQLYDSYNYNRKNDAIWRNSGMHSYNHSHFKVSSFDWR